VSSQAHTSYPPSDNPRGCIEEQPKGLRSAIYSALDLLLQISIEWLVRLTGRRIRKRDAPWLDCVLGKPGVIGTGVYQRIAQEEKLALSQPPNAGLIENFDSLRGPSFDPDQVDPRIRHFYEHAALYRLEVWSEVYFAGKFVLWLLVEFISRRMDQLNSPISSLEVAKGMTSGIMQLREPGTGRLVHTGWLRRFKSTGKIIYAGLFHHESSGRSEPLRKSDFPLLRK